MSTGIILHATDYQCFQTVKPGTTFNITSTDNIFKIDTHGNILLNGKIGGKILLDEGFNIDSFYVTEYYSHTAESK